MKRILVAIDSFKGSMSSLEASSVIAENLQNDNCIVDTMPISDGGEGFLDALAKNKLRETAASENAIGKENRSTYLVSEDGKTLYFELAESVGIKDLENNELNVYHASTYGLGMTIRAGIERQHPEKIVLGIGGSASNDGGSGLLEALGVRFYDANGSLLSKMCNEKLALVESIDTSLFEELTKGIKLTVLTDVTNPLLGKNGATYVYGRQKGAKQDDFALLEANMAHFASVCTSLLGIEQTMATGAGAAGGVGYGLLAFWKATLASGIDYILAENNFPELVKSYDIVISGEGRLDSQSLQGKVISGIIKHQPKAVWLVVGSSALDDCPYPVFSVVPTVATLEESMAQPRECLARLIQQIKKRSFE